MILQEFIKKSNITHNNIYEYGNEIKDNKCGILCKEHGLFYQNIYSHIFGKGCPSCGKKKRFKHTTDSFIIKANKIHFNGYDYSNVVYGKDNNVAIDILCKTHGIFKQTPRTHLCGGGCPSCGTDKMAAKIRKTNEDFLSHANKIHGSKYKYLTSYKTGRSKIKIECKIHGIFEQAADNHLVGAGCILCSRKIMGENSILTQDEFLEKAKKLHGVKYKYGIYTGYKNKIKIECPKHGIFEQAAASHLQGHGCSECHESNGERIITNLLQEMNIKYLKQHKFDDCRGITQRLRFDFYLPDLNICIEYDGKQHYAPIKFMGGEKALKIIMGRDIIKNNYCDKNNIKLLRITYKDKIESKIKENLK